jgi:hypothetical protein
MRAIEGTEQGRDLTGTSPGAEINPGDSADDLRWPYVASPSPFLVPCLRR